MMLVPDEFLLLRQSQLFQRDLAADFLFCIGDKTRNGKGQKRAPQLTIEIVSADTPPTQTRPRINTGRERRAIDTRQKH